MQNIIKIVRQHKVSMFNRDYYKLSTWLKILSNNSVCWLSIVFTLARDLFSRKPRIWNFFIVNYKSKNKYLNIWEQISKYISFLVIDADNLQNCLRIWSLQMRAANELRDIIFSYDYGAALEEDRVLWSSIVSAYNRVMLRIRRGRPMMGLPLKIAIAQLRINHNHIKDLQEDIREKLNLFAKIPL